MTLVEALLSKIGEAIAESAFAVFVEQGQKLTERLKQDLRLASNQYGIHFCENYGTIKILTNKPRRLEEVYVPLNFIDDSFLKLFYEKLTEKSTDEIDSAEFQLNYSQESIVSDIDAANKYQYLVVLGQPGSGKSVYLKKIALEALKSKVDADVDANDYKHSYIPVFIELKRFNSQPIKLEDSIIEEFSLCGMPNPESLVKRLLEKGKLLILLDGLDEVINDKFSRMVEEIEAFTNRYYSNRFIISCRKAAYRYPLKKFADLTILDFDDTQIRNFIENWFKSEELPIKFPDNVAASLWNTLENIQNEGTKELGRTPLILVLLCWVYGSSMYQSSSSLPSSRVEIYRKALDFFLKGWLEQNRVNLDSNNNLDSKVERQLLSHLAYWSFSNKKFYFNEDELIESINIFLNSLPNSLTNSAEEIVKSIRIYKGIIIERSPGIFSFSHMTFQEYLSALYISNIYKKKKESLVDSLRVDEKFSSFRWREVFLMLIELIETSEDQSYFLNLLEKKAYSYICNNDKIQTLITWSYQATLHAEGSYAHVLRRAIALYLVRVLDSLRFMKNVQETDVRIKDSYTVKLDSSSAGISYLAQTKAFLEFPDLLMARALVTALGLDLSQLGAYVLDTHVANLLHKLKVFNKEIDFQRLVIDLEYAAKLASETSSESELAYKNQTLQLWWKTLCEKPELAAISRESVLLFKDYLYVNTLLIDCKELAHYVSEDELVKLENRILNVKPKFYKLFGS